VLRGVAIFPFIKTTMPSKRYHRRRTKTFQIHKFEGRKGFGLVACRDIREGEVITRYPRNENPDEKTIREADDSFRNMLAHYSININGTKYYGEPLPRDWSDHGPESTCYGPFDTPMAHMMNDVACIEPYTDKETMSAFLRRCIEYCQAAACEANCTSSKNFDFVATKPIPKGTEITFPYGIGYWMSKVMTLPASILLLGYIDKCMAEITADSQHHSSPFHRVIFCKNAIAITGLRMTPPFCSPEMTVKWFDCVHAIESYKAFKNVL
jgi:hypothetical protein